MPVVEGVFVFPTEDKHDKNPLQTLESVGKELLTDFLQGLVEKDVLKLEEAEKKKFHDAKAGDKPWVLLHLVREKRKEAGQAFVQTFVNTDKRSTSVEGKPKSHTRASQTLQSPPPSQALRVLYSSAVLHDWSAGFTQPVTVLPRAILSFGGGDPFPTS